MRKMVFLYQIQQKFKMKRLLFILLLIGCSCVYAQGQPVTIGSVKTEEYKASFEQTQSIDVVSNYTDTIKYPIQLLKIGFTEELYEMYPELKDKRVGLGVTNIVIEFLEMTNRFEFTEDKLEIKERMVATSADIERITAQLAALK